MKKSFLSLALALALCLSLAVPAFAAGETVTVIDDKSWFGDEATMKPIVSISGVYTQIEDGVFPNLGRTHGSYFCESGATITLDSIWHTEEEYEAGLISEDEYENTLELIVWPFTEKEYQDQYLPESTADVVKGRSHTLSDGIYLVEIGRSGGPFYEINVIVGKTGLSGNGFPDYPSGTTDPGSMGFTDVTPGDWFYEPVQWAVKEGVTNGTSLTTFSPNQDCTVAHILTFLWRANGSPKAEGDNPFSDVKADDWFYGAALWAYEKGMVTGDTFNPNTLCTRSMAVKYLWQAAGSPSAKASSFTDVPAGADYAQAVNWAVEKGITNGTSLTTFSPSEVCTRGHIVTFLYRDLAK